MHTVTGSDSNPGTSEAPLQSIQACVDAISHPGDRCLLKAGIHPVGAEDLIRVDGKAGTPSQRVAVAGAGDGPVVLDGTVSIAALAASRTPSRAAAWEPAPEVARHVYKLSLAKDKTVTQLFVGLPSADDTLHMLVPARWPNADWNPKTMFMGPEHWAHAGPAFGGAEHNVSTGRGLLLDAGACSESGQSCCSECNNNSLAASGINATGAVAILNMWCALFTSSRSSKHG
eukprot:SAG31_NODE_7314_length_1722_cov_1.138016_2_plen_230_part_00